MQIKEIKVNPKNPRIIKDARFQKLVKSIEEFPEMMKLRPIVVDADGMILGGNMRYKALQHLGFKEIPDEWVKRADELTEEQKRRFIITDNVPYGDWDWDILANEWDVPKLSDWGIDFPEDWMPKQEAQEDDYEVPDEIETDIALGDLFEIGPHRLLCGDSTDSEQMAKLMNGEKADMVFTDPPYNVASESRNYAADKSKAMKDLSQSEWDKNFDITAVFPMLDEILAQDCAVYVCTSQWLVQTIWEWMWKWSDFCSYCVWCKPNPMPSLSKRHWTWATELIPYAVRGKHISNFPSDGHALNWWAIPKNKDTEHPTEKVLEVPTRAIQFSSNKGAIIFDGFCGSGTTMVAAHQLNRKCYGMEIDSKYCSVIIDRMRKLDPNITIKRNGELYEKTFCGAYKSR